MVKNKYYGFIQKDKIGNIIDIFTLDGTNHSILESFSNDENYIVLPLNEAIEFSKKNPQKKFFIYNESDEVLKILSKNGIEI
jgi:hypothetical protein